MITVNQLMLLMDIYRGTDTQFQLGTFRDDNYFLLKHDLIIDIGYQYITTEKGDALVNGIKGMTDNVLLLTE